MAQTAFGRRWTETAPALGLLAGCATKPVPMLSQEGPGREPSTGKVCSLQGQPQDPRAGQSKKSLPSQVNVHVD